MITDGKQPIAEPAPKCRLLITGATGYIGRRMVAAARHAGHDIVATARKADRLRERTGVTPRVFDLRHPDGFVDDFPVVDGVIHLAAVISEDSHPAGRAEDINVSGTRRLLESARRGKVSRFVFVSSQSAAADAPSRYGRAKWAVEQALTGPGEIVVRPGMVTGGPTRGLYGTLYRLCRSLPWIPMIRASAPVYPVHVDDLCAEIVRLATTEALAGERLVVVAPTAPQRFADYVRMIASERAGQPVRLLPFPGALAVWASGISQRVRWLPTISGERVAGLLALRAYPDRNRSGLSRMRDVRASLGLEGRRRRLIAEGRTLLRYVLGAPAPAGAVRRYVRAVQREDANAPLRMSRLVQAWPRALRLQEPLGQATPLGRRLSLATRIAELTPAGARRFHSYEARSLPVAVVSVGASLIVETLLLPLRLLASRTIHRRAAERGIPGDPPP